MIALNTPIHFIKNYHSNAIYFKRDDLLPFSFGGNKYRKALNFFKEIIVGDYNTVVTYGSSHSNHVRMVSNLAYKHNIRCIVITPKAKNEGAIPFNQRLTKSVQAEFIESPLENIKETIQSTLFRLKNNHDKPYFIPGGGHGYLGTQAYVEAFGEILAEEVKMQKEFNYIFLASGTGATQAGLIVGDIINNTYKKIIGISVARNNGTGTKVVEKSVGEYLKTKKINFKHNLNITFVDSYLVNGYGTKNREIVNIIQSYYNEFGVPLDPIYTGKAVWGMEDYIIKKGIKNSNILFIHTGGTPIFFDYIGEQYGL